MKLLAQGHEKPTRKQGLSVALRGKHPDPLGRTQRGKLACVATPVVSTAFCSFTCGNCLSNT